MIKLKSITFVVIAAFMFAACGSKETSENEKDTKVEEKEVTEVVTEIETSSVKTPSEVKTTEAFSYLETLKVGTNVFLKYNKKLTVVVNKPVFKLDKSDPFYQEPGEMGMDMQILVKTKITESGDEYAIMFSSGPSDDPTFLIYKADTPKEPIADIYALELYIPGTGFIYSAGHTNNLFNTRKKFKLSGNKITEVKQPFYYVGKESKTLKAVKLYDSESMSNVVAQLPADYSVEVLINKAGTNNFLIKTDFGLTGWVEMENPMYGNETVEGIYYSGD